MKKKKMIIIFLFILIVLFSSLFFLDENKSRINTNKVNEMKKINIKVSEKFESKLYAQVLNDVVNDYSYHDYNSEKIVNNDIDYVNNEICKDDSYLINENAQENAFEVFDEEENNDEEESSSDEKIIEEESSGDEKIIEEENNDEEESINEEEISVDIKKDEKCNDTLAKTGFYEENGITYYYENDNKVTGVKNIDGVNNYFSPSGKYLGTNNIKVLDISYYQGDINWDELALNGDFYGVILRVGYYTFPDKKFEEYIANVKRLNIPYGIYLFSYSTDINGSSREASFTNNMIDKYNLIPELGIYYDIESWSSKNATSDYITKNGYDEIIENYINTVSSYVNNKYKVKVYSGRWYAMNRLGESKRYVDWVAEYNNSCLYDDAYSMWQYTSTGSMPGINGNVDISYLLT